MDHIRQYALILLMNMVDAIATLTWIRAGFAQEANPTLMRLLETGGEASFLTFKLVAGSIVITAAALGTTPRVRYALLLCFALITLHHVPYAAYYLLHP